MTHSHELDFNMKLCMYNMQSIWLIISNWYPHTSSWCRCTYIVSLVTVAHKLGQARLCAFVSTISIRLKISTSHPLYSVKDLFHDAITVQYQIWSLLDSKINHIQHPSADVFTVTLTEVPSGCYDLPKEKPMIRSLRF